MCVSIARNKPVPTYYFITLLYTLGGVRRIFVQGRCPLRSSCLRYLALFKKRTKKRLFGLVFYPTTSPVGIVSICDPVTDQLLLIRQPRCEERERQLLEKSLAVVRIRLRCNANVDLRFASASMQIRIQMIKNSA